MTPKPLPAGELRKLLAAATKGPWRLEDCRAKKTEGHCWCAVISSDEANNEGIANAGCITRENAALIVAAINNLEALLDAVEERDELKARAERAELEAHRAWRHEILSEARREALGEAIARAEQAESSLSEMRKENERLREEAIADEERMFNAIRYVAGKDTAEAVRALLYDTQPSSKEE